MAAGAAALPASSRIAWAQAYPARPVRWIVGFPPGGAADLIARSLAQWLSERLGQQFIIENRPGAGSNIAAEAVVRASSDGYTLLLVVATNTVNATLYDKLSFNFISDIVPVASIGRTPFIMVVNQSVPAKTVPEFIAYAKANAGKLNMASSGIGTSAHVFGELFKAMAGVDLVKAAVSPSRFARRTGAANLYCNPWGHWVHPNGPAPRLGGDQRAALADAARHPDQGEFVQGYEASGWEGIGAPKGTPVEIIDKLNKEVNVALADPKMKADLAKLGSVATPMSPADFGKFIIEEAEKWGKVVRAAKIKLE